MMVVVAEEDLLSSHPVRVTAANALSGLFFFFASAVTAASSRIVRLCGAYSLPRSYPFIALLLPCCMVPNFYRDILLHNMK